MKRGTPDHPKVHALATEMNIPHALAVGYLELLWHFTAKYAPQGDIGKFPDEIIAKGCRYRGKPDRLIAALCTTGWLEVWPRCRLASGEVSGHLGRGVPEVCPRCRLGVHDWHDHADESVKVYLKRNNLQFLTLNNKMSRQNSDTIPTVSRQITDSVGILSPSRAPVPLPEPEPIKISKKKTASKKSGLSAQQAAWFDTWWASVWIRVGRGAAEKAFRSIVATQDTFDMVLGATKIQSLIFSQRDRQYQPHPATWLNGKRWLDEIKSPAEQSSLPDFEDLVKDPYYSGGRQQ